MSCGGSIINKKLLLSVLLLFGLTLLFNSSISSAASTNHTNTISVGVNQSAATSTTSNKYSKNPTTTTIHNVATTHLVKTNIVVNGLTTAQLKDGLSRVLIFYHKNGRLPNYVHFGTRHILIKTFKLNLATQGIRIHVKPNTSSVYNLAKSCTIGSLTTYESAVTLFNWVRDNVSYSFYYNTRYGASGTLAKRIGNCCDKSNLLVALARDVGIKARFVHGTCYFIDNTWSGHVWAQLYANGKWYTADTINKNNTLGVITNWNTTTYKLNGVYTTLPF